MLKDQYRREMDQIVWTREQEQRLREKMEEASGKSRQMARRFILIPAICAALLVGALAAGSVLWQKLQTAQGPFAGIAQTVEGATCTDEGIEVQVLSALADEVRSKVYFTVRDVEGDRLDEALTLKKGERGDVTVGSAELLAYDPESRTALFSTETRNDLNETTGETVSLHISGMSTQYGYLEEGSASCAGVSQEILDSRPLDASDRVVLKTDDLEGNTPVQPEKTVVLAPGQTPGALEGTTDMSVSSMGFASDGCFHVRLTYREGVEDSSTLEGGGFYAFLELEEETEREWAFIMVRTADGVDVCFPDVRVGEGRKPERVVFYGTYQRPGMTLKGDWEVSFQMERQSSRVLDWTGTLAGRQIREVCISPLTVTMKSNDIGGFSSTSIYAVLEDGTLIEGKKDVGSYSNVSQSPTGEAWQAYNTWSFVRPVSLEEIVALRLLEEEIPVN